MKELGYKTLVDAHQVDRAQFDIRRTIDLAAEQQLRRYATGAGLTPTGEVTRQEIPVVWELGTEEEKTYLLRPAREGEKPDGYEFRYHQYAE